MSEHNRPTQHAPTDDQPYWRKGEGPEKYTARVWCTTHDKVEPVGTELCPHCSSILSTKGGYRAAFGYGSRWFNNQTNNYDNNDTNSLATDGGVDQATASVRNAVALLNDFEDVSTEVQHGAIKHAIEELRNARRELPDD